MHGCEANSTQGKAQILEDERAAVPGGIVVIDGANNLVNMIAVTTVSSAVLLTLLAIQHF
jgi:hypothetical protein